MRFARRGALSAVVMVLAGCYTVTPVPTTQPSDPAPSTVPQRVVVREKIVETRTISDTDRLLDYYATTAALPRDQWSKELERARRQYESEATSYARMQWIMARLAANGEVKEHDKALELLQLQLSSKDDIAPELRALASMLRQLLGDNRQLEGNLDAQREKLKEEMKKSEALKQKLDAIVEAERKLQERNRPK